MGTGVVGGMLAATFVATIFIPLFFVLVARRKKPRARRRGARARRMRARVSRCLLACRLHDRRPGLQAPGDAVARRISRPRDAEAGPAVPPTGGRSTATRRSTSWSPRRAPTTPTCASPRRRCRKPRRVMRQARAALFPEVTGQLHAHALARRHAHRAAAGSHRAARAQRRAPGAPRPRSSSTSGDASAAPTRRRAPACSARSSRARWSA